MSRAEAIKTVLDALALLVEDMDAVNSRTASASVWLICAYLAVHAEEYRPHFSDDDIWEMVKAEWCRKTDTSGDRWSALLKLTNTGSYGELSDALRDLAM
jgi:hypothetical protein